MVKICRSIEGLVNMSNDYNSPFRSYLGITVSGVLSLPITYEGLFFTSSSFI